MCSTNQRERQSGSWTTIPSLLNCFTASLVAMPMDDCSLHFLLIIKFFVSGFQLPVRTVDVDVYGRKFDLWTFELQS